MSAGWSGGEGALGEEDAEVAGLIMTFWADHPKWSYCRLAPDGYVVEVVEKKVISNEATVGLYNFRRGRDFVDAADVMIKRNLRVNNEFYVAPVYNLLIERGARIVVRQTGREYAGMYGLGTPEDYEFFQTTQQFRNNCLKDYRSPMLRQRPKLERLTEFCVQSIQTNNRAGLDVLMHPEMQFYVPGVYLVGRDVVRCWIKKFLSGSDELNVEMYSILVDGDMTVVEFVNASGLAGALLLTWEGDLIRRLCIYTNDRP